METIEEWPFKIDFVVSWVDGSDSKWLNKKRRYVESAKKEEDSFNGDNRYRELGLFKYWFRAVERYAPWVNKIYLVTDKQVPDFLEFNNPKISIVDHSDFIDSMYLPTFNSSTIEMNLDNIPGLSDHFVYFNDDFFLTKKVSPSDFFTADGKVKDTIAQSVIMPVESYDHNLVNNTKALNLHFDKKSVILNNFRNFFNLKQGVKLFGVNVVLSIFPRFTRLFDPHTAYSLDKNMMKEAKELILPELNEAFRNRKRGLNDYTIQWVRYYQIATGNAKVRPYSFGKTANSNDVSQFKKLLTSKKHSVVNLQDENATLEQVAEISATMETYYPGKSEFEK